MAHLGDILYQGKLDEQKRSERVDLNRILPLGAVRLDGCRGESSLDGEAFEPLGEGDQQGRTARYLRFELPEGRARADVTVQAGSGFYAEEEPYWTDAFCRRDRGRGWRGGDGVYSLLVKDDPLPSRRKVLFTFGDTLISDINPDDSRVEPLDMVNNTYAILTGEDAKAPGGLRFHIEKDAAGRDTSLIEPADGVFDYAGAGLIADKTYYWMQDWALAEGGLLTFPMLLTDDKTQPEGFQFRLLGTAMAKIPLKDGEPDFSRSRQYPLNLHLKEEGREILYGGCVLRKAGRTVCDGYVYLYGYITRKDGRFLCVSRVPEGQAAERSSWRFFDGEDFVPDIGASAPLMNHVSTEFSVTYIEDGPLKGKYLLVCQYDTNSRYVAVSLADSPTGPFQTPQRVFDCPESGTGAGTYTYNAKLHAPLSDACTLIASYNVNTTSWQEHVDQALLYRPRFLRLRHTLDNDWDDLFATAFRQRREQFRLLNRMAEQGAIVFAGDSLIQEFPLEEFFPAHRVYNRGIGGDTTQGLLRRLDDSVLPIKPRLVFLLIGTNDLAFGAKPADLVSRIQLACRQIRDSLPGCRVCVLSLLPVNDSDHPKLNPLAVGSRNNVDIRAINAQLRLGADQQGYRLIDTHAALADPEGRLALPYTREGLHLSPEGYAALAEVVRGVMG